VSVWGKLAETCGEWLLKGSSVCVEGQLRTRETQHKEHPEITLYFTEVVAESVLFLAGTKQRGQQ
jgi:single-strand DNA-binding protein